MRNKIIATVISAVVAAVSLPVAAQSQWMQQQAGGDTSAPPGFFTSGRDSAPPGFWNGSGTESNAGQFQRNMSGIAAGVRSAADMAVDGQRAAAAADAIPGRSHHRGNATVTPNGIAIQDRGQSRSEVNINGRRYIQRD